MKRLIKKGFIGEFVDQENRRSKRLKLTSKGLMEIDICMPQIQKLSDMLTWDLTKDDIELFTRLLGVIDAKYSFLVQAHKGKGFENIYKSMGDGRPELSGQI